MEKMTDRIQTLANSPYVGPYVGPYPIQAGQPFFGRTLETTELASRLTARRVVLLLAPSGAGKTSLIQAGLIPEMELAKYLVLPIVHLNRMPNPDDLPAGQPNRFILSCLLSLDSALPDGQRTPIAEMATRSLQAESLNEYLAEFRDRFAVFKNQADRKRTLLIFDQFEEILTIQPAARALKEQFFNELMPVLDDNHYWVLFAMREDYLARLDPYLGYFPERLSAHFQLDFLGLEAARLAIVEPVKPYQTNYTEDAAAKLVHDLSLVRVLDETNRVVEQPGQYVEPVELQVVCERLWRADRPDPSLITLDDVLKFGKVIDSLAGYYSDTVKKTAAASNVSERNIRQWFEQALIAEGGLRQPVPQGREIEFGLTPECAASLVNAYLVRVEEQRGTPWYRLAHDRLVEAVLGDNARWNAENLSLLQRQALVWEREGRPDRLLLQDTYLAQAEEWNRGSHEPLNQGEDDLMERSRDLQKEKAAALEKERLNNRRIRRYLVAAVSVAVVAILALVLVVWSLGEVQKQKEAAQIAQGEAVSAKTTADFNAVQAGKERSIAVENRKIADENAAEALIQKNKASTAQARAETEEVKVKKALIDVERLATQSAQDQAKAVAEQANALSQRLAFQAQQIVNKDPDLAALLSIEAFQAGRTTEATNMLLSSIYTSTVRIEPVKDIGGLSSNIYSLAISPDENTLAIGCGNGEVLLVDLGDEFPRPVALPARHEDVVNGLAFSPDGALLASSSKDRKLLLFRMESLEWKRYDLNGLSSGLSFRQDGRRLAVAEGYEYSIFVVTPGNPELGTKKKFLEGRKSGFIHEIAYSPDGFRLAVSHQGESGVAMPDWVIVYNAENGGREYLSEDHTQIIPGLAWSIDNRTLVTVSLDGQIIASDTLLKSSTKVPNAHDNKSIFSVAVSYDGRFAISGGWDAYTRVWSMPDLISRGEVSNTNLLQDVMAVAISPRSYLFASGGTDKVVRMYRLVTQPSLAEPIKTVNGQVRGLVVDTDSQLFWLYPNKQDGGYYRVESTDPNFLAEKPALIGNVFSAALHPNGKLAVYGGEDGVIYSVLAEEPIEDPWPALETGQEARGMAFNQDGTRLASSHCSQPAPGGKCLSSSIWIWDVDTRTPKFFTEVKGTGFIRALAFDPAGKHLAVGAEDGTVAVFDLASGKPLPLNIKPSQSEVLSLAYSRDGRMLAGGNRAGDMLLWDAGSGYPDIGRMNIGSSGALYSLAFDLAGEHLFTGGASGDILRWAISPDLWIKIICERVGRNLTADEWRTFFFNDEVEQTCPIP